MQQTSSYFSIPSQRATRYANVVEGARSSILCSEDEEKQRFDEGDPMREKIRTSFLNKIMAVSVSASLLFRKLVKVANQWSSVVLGRVSWKW